MNAKEKKELKTYEEAVVIARKAYHEAKATAFIRGYKGKTYQEAIAPALKAYIEAEKAHAKAEEVFGEGE